MFFRRRNRHFDEQIQVCDLLRKLQFLYPDTVHSGPL
jgi:hypothetical protein